MNRLQLFVILVIMSAMLNCSADNETSKKTIDQNNNASATTGSTNASAPDNTARNDRDRNSQAITPIDQLENSSDLKITQQIRQSIMDDSSLSTNAKNVKIVTQEQVVTLRGVVENAREKRKIESFAKQLVTSKKVNNQLEIKSGS